MPRRSRPASSGAGLEIPLPGITTFVEVRFNSAVNDFFEAVGGGSNVNYVPVKVGIRF